MDPAHPCCPGLPAPVPCLEGVVAQVAEDASHATAGLERMRHAFLHVEEGQVKNAAVRTQNAAVEKSASLVVGEGHYGFQVWGRPGRRAY
jgi:hypothetical protein